MKPLKMLTPPIKASIIAAVFLLAAMSVRAVDWNTTSGDWSVPENWDPQAVPVQGDAVNIAPQGDGTNTVSLSDDVSAAFASLKFLSAAGRTLAFDGRNQTLLLPDAEGPYADPVVTFRYPDDKSYMKIGAGKETEASSAAPMKAENATFILDADAGNNLSLALAGLWNFYDPDGVAHPGRTFEVGEASKAGTTTFAMSGKDTQATFPEFHFRANATTNRLWLADGTYKIFGNWYSTGGNQLDMLKGGIIEVDICDGADVTVVGKTLLHAVGGSYGTTNPALRDPYRFRVADSKLTTSNTYEAAWSLDGLTYVTNATWNAPVPTGTAIAIGHAVDTEWFYTTTQRLVAVDSKFLVGKAHNAGNFAVGKLYGSGSTTYGAIYATNCTFDIRSWFMLRWGEGILKDCTWTGNDADNYSISVENRATLTLDGGTYTRVAPRLNFGTTGKFGPTLNIRGATIGSATRTWNIGWADSAANCSKTCTVHMTSGEVISRWLYLSPSAQPGHFILEGGTYFVKQTSGGNKTHAKNPSGGGWAHFTANGGTIRCPDQETYQYNRPLFNDLDCLDVGPNGFNLDTNGKKNHFMVQDVTNMPGEKGRFVKRGAESFRVCIPSKWDVAETAVEAGTLVIGTNGVSTAVTMETAMSVGPGATLSLVGKAESLTIDSLAVTNGTLALDADDTITVKGAFAPSLMKLNFSGELAEDAPVDIFVFEEPLSSESVAELKVALVTSAYPAGTSPVIELTTDPQGRTTVTVTAKKVPVVTDETVWHGADSAWGTAANWSAGVPTATKAALLTDAAAVKEIEVTGDRELGTLTMSDDGFAVGGEGRLDFAAYGNSRIDVTEGSHGISAGLLTRETMTVDVAPEASLTFSGVGEGRGFAKEGKGRMALEGEGRFSIGTVKSHGGRLVVSNAAAFAGATLTLGNGTLEIPETVTIVDGGRLAIAATNAKNAVVVDNAGDATFTGLDITKGCLVKRGRGTLTLDLSDGKSESVARSDGGYQAGGGVFANASAWAFDEDGTPPSFGYAGLSVMGGELVIKGDGRTSVKTAGAIVVGTHTTSDCGSQPILTLDNLKLNFSGVYHEFVVGNRAGCKGYFAKTPLLRVLNGSTVTVGSDFKLSSDYTSDNTPGAHPMIAITNSAVIAKNNGAGDPSIYFSTLRARGGAVASLYAANAHLEAPQFSCCGTTDSRITGSTLTGVDGAYSKLGSDQYRKGRVLFDGGTVLKIKTLALTGYHATYTKMMTWAFDDATWDFGNDDFAISSENCYLPLNRFEMVGTGLRLAPAAGKTFRTDAVFMGEGGLVKSGEGTLAFSEGTYRFTGPLCALAGTVDLSAAGPITNACFGAGDGVISGATLVNPVFRLDAGAPTLANCTMSGRVRLDVGDEPLVKPYPTDLTVMRFTGTAPNVSNWRLSGAGKKGLGGTFTVQGNEVKVTIDERGMVLIVR